MKWSGRVAIAVAIVAGTAAAWADDRPFAWTYTTRTEAQHGREVEQEVTWASGQAREAFQEIESRTEFEYGFTDQFQGSFYLTYAWSRTRPHDPLGPAETSSLPGISGEFIYQVLNVDFDPIGLALYAEPSIGNGSRSVELKALLQKDFLNDALRVALNINVEDRWEKNGAGHYDQSSALEFYGGVAYSLSDEWNIAAEVSNERGFDGELLGGSSRYADNAWFVGPTLSYYGQPWRIVVGAQMQMPWASDPTHTPGTLANGMLADAEHFRLRLRFSRDI